MIDCPTWAFSRGQKSIRLVASDELENIHKPILLIGGVHGDEPEGTTLALSVLDWLIDDAGKQHSWIVIPVLNPDGVEKKERVNGAGVDLNRNYPSKSWSKDFTQPRYNPGPFPASEPEIAALVQLIEKTKPRLIIHCHSWHPCIVAVGNPLEAQTLSAVSGYKLMEDIGYPTPGSLSEYGWFDHQIPVICIEEQENIDLQTIWPRFQTAFETIFRGDQN